MVELEASPPIGARGLGAREWAPTLRSSDSLRIDHTLYVPGARDHLTITFYDRCLNKLAAWQGGP